MSVPKMEPSNEASWIESNVYNEVLEECLIEESKVSISISVSKNAKILMEPPNKATNFIKCLNVCPCPKCLCLYTGWSVTCLLQRV